jgi:hypothetical protein
LPRMQRSRPIWPSSNSSAGRNWRVADRVGGKDLPASRAVGASAGSRALTVSCTRSVARLGSAMATASLPGHVSAPTSSLQAVECSILSPLSPTSAARLLLARSGVQKLPN